MHFFVPVSVRHLLRAAALAIVEFLVLLVLLIAAVIYFRGRVREVSARVDALAAERAQRLFEEWRAKELTSVRAQYEAQYAELKRQMEAQYAAMLAEKV